MNPSERNGTLSSSTAIGLLNGVRAAECGGTTAVLSATSCLLTGLRNFTEYEVVVEVCTEPEGVVGVRGGDCNYCSNTSSSGHRTSSGAPDAANITSVLARPFETLEVRWMNPSERNGTLLSSTAIALLNGVRVAECSGITAALSSAICSLTGLRNFTVYEVVVEVCTGSADVVGVRRGDRNYCTTKSSLRHRTSPGAPHAANISNVITPAFGALEVHWRNPSISDGSLLLSTAIGLLDGQKAAECYGKTASPSAASCLLTGLKNFEVYEVVVVVCILRLAREHAAFGDDFYCTNSYFDLKATLPGVFESHQLTALDNEILNSHEAVADPLTQISIKVALSTLPIDDVGPVSIHDHSPDRRRIPISNGRGDLNTHFWVISRRQPAIPDNEMGILRDSETLDVNRSQFGASGVLHFGPGYDWLTTANKPEMVAPVCLVFVDDVNLPIMLTAELLQAMLETEPESPTERMGSVARSTPSTLPLLVFPIEAEGTASTWLSGWRRCTSN
ncbi:hypothetical protein SprV_0802628900 [Sparganum proliferum]